MNFLGTRNFEFVRSKQLGAGRCKGAAQCWQAANEEQTVTRNISRDSAAADMQRKKNLQRRAAVLQSFLFLFSFLVITVGVAFESKTKSSDLDNSMWAFVFVVPASGFLFSLMNSFFISEYKTVKKFQRGAVLATLLFSAIAYVLTSVHYQLPLWVFVYLFKDLNLFHFLLAAIALHTCLLCAVSYGFAAKYWAWTLSERIDLNEG